MSRKKRHKPASGRALRRALKERRFSTDPTQMRDGLGYLGMVTCAALGVGSYAAWISDEPAPFALPLVAAGALGLVLVMWRDAAGARSVLVGDCGVAVEQRDASHRVPWYELKRVFQRNRALVVESEATTLEISLTTEPVAAAAIVREAARRVPSRLDISTKLHDSLPKLRETDGELVGAPDVQVTGLRCAESGETLSFERDARLCPQCGQVYHKDSLPESCKTCDASLSAGAIQL